MRLLVLVNMLSCLMHNVAWGKKLESPKVDFFNKILQSNPHFIARLQLSKKEVNEVLQLLEEKGLDNFKELTIWDKPTIYTKISDILNPVNSFFDDLKDYPSLFTELLELSFGENKAQGADEKKQLCIAKFLASSKNSYDFFYDEVTNQNQLQSLCLELKQLYDDLNDSFSAEVKKECRSFAKNFTCSRACKKDDCTTVFIE